MELFSVLFMDICEIVFPGFQEHHLEVGTVIFIRTVKLLLIVIKTFLV